MSVFDMKEADQIQIIEAIEPYVKRAIAGGKIEASHEDVTDFVKQIADDIPELIDLSI